MLNDDKIKSELRCYLFRRNINEYLHEKFAVSMNKQFIFTLLHSDDVKYIPL